VFGIYISLIGLGFKQALGDTAEPNAASGSASEAELCKQASAAAGTNCGVKLPRRTTLAPTKIDPLRSGREDRSLPDPKQSTLQRRVLCFWPWHLFFRFGLQARLGDMACPGRRPRAQAEPNAASDDKNILIY